MNLCNLIVLASAASENVDPGSASIVQWFIFAGVIIGPLSVIYYFGKREGVQDQKNSDFDKRITSNEEDIGIMKSDLAEIKTGISYIKGQLVATDHIQS